MMVLWRKRYLVDLDMWFEYTGDHILVALSFCMDGQGHFYFSDLISRRIVKLDGRGRLLATFGVAPSLKSDEEARHKWFGMCVSPGGDVMYCWSERNEGMLVKYDRRGTVLREVRLSNSPFQIKSDSTGALWIALYHKENSANVSYIMQKFDNDCNLQDTYTIPDDRFHRDASLLIGPGDSDNLFLVSKQAPFSMWGLRGSSHELYKFDDISSTLPTNEAIDADGQPAGQMNHFSDIIWYAPLRKVLLLHTKQAIYLFDENGKFSGIAYLPTQIFKLCCNKMSKLFGFQLGDTSYVHRLIIREPGRNSGSHLNY